MWYLREVLGTVLLPLRDLTGLGCLEVSPHVWLQALMLRLARDWLRDWARGWGNHQQAQGWCWRLHHPQGWEAMCPEMACWAAEGLLMLQPPRVLVPVMRIDHSLTDVKGQKGQ